MKITEYDLHNAAIVIMQHARQNLPVIIMCQSNRLELLHLCLGKAMDAPADISATLARKYNHIKVFTDEQSAMGRCAAAVVFVGFWHGYETEAIGRPIVARWEIESFQEGQIITVV